MTVNFKKISFWIFSLVLTALVLLIVSLILLAMKTNPLTFLAVIFLEPWKNLTYFSGFINVFAILLLASLAVSVTFKYRIYNFGVSGQMLVSAIVTYITAISITNAGGHNQFIVIFLIVLSAIVGSLIGFVVAFLRNCCKINEIISTILFNFIAWEGYKGFLASPIYQNNPFPKILNLRFSLVSGPFSASNLFSAGIIVAVVVLIVAILIFNSRTLGFKLNAVAKNPLASKQARISPNHQVLKVLPISGAIAGLAGYLYFLATNNGLPKLSFIPQEGFYASLIGGLAFYEPSIIVFSNFMITLFVRPINLNSFAYLRNPALIVVILAVVVYLMAFFPFIWYLWDQSPLVQEKWYKLKKRLFKVSTSIETEIPDILQSNKKQEIEALNIDLENKPKVFEKWKIKRKNKKTKKKR